MERNKKNHEIFYQIFKFFVIVCVIMLFGSSLWLNYDANKRFDKIWMIEYKDLGISKGFDFTDEARSEPVFYWQWDCVITKDQQYWICDHEPIIEILGESKHHVFKLYELTEQQIQEKEDLMQIRSKAHFSIFWLSVILILNCVAFWGMLYKIDRENWEKTPFARLIRWIEKHKDEIDLGDQEDEEK